MSNRRWTAAAIVPPERDIEECDVFRAIAALALASATAHASTSTTLSSSAPWWERVTVTVTGDGQPRSCRYETSLQPSAAQHCDVSDDQAAVVASSDKG